MIKYLLLCLLIVQGQLSSAGIADFLLICNGSGACEIKNAVSSMEGTLDDSLDISQYNKLNITDLATVKNITFINSTFRSFSAYLLRAMPGLQHIDAVSCGVDNRDVQIFGPASLGNAERLETLVLTNNSITTLAADTFSAAVNLRELHLTNNRIERVHKSTFTGLGRLEFLDLGHNQLTLLEDNLFTPLVSLTRVFLNHNLLKTVDLKVFSSNQVVEFISLKDNLLEVVSASAPTFFKTIDLSGNHLTNLEVQNFPNLQEIQLERNAWNCSNLLQVVNRLQDLGVRILKPVEDDSHPKPNVVGIECTVPSCSNAALLEQLVKLDTKSRQASKQLEDKITELGNKLHALESNMMVMLRHLMNIQPDNHKNAP